MTDHYKILEVDPHVTSAEIKRQFKAMIFKWHPDKCPPPCSEVQNKERTEKTRQIIEANKVLGNEGKRKKYNVEYFRKNPHKARSTNKTKQKKETKKGNKN